MPRKKSTPSQASVEPGAEQPQRPADPFAHLPTVAALFQSVQRDRVGLERALETRGSPDAEADLILQELRNLEKRTVNYLTSRCEPSSVYPWLRDIKGIGERLAGMLIGLIDIKKCDSVSSLWRYSGFGVVCAECRIPFTGVCPTCNSPQATVNMVVCVNHRDVAMQGGLCPSCQGVSGLSICANDRIALVNRCAQCGGTTGVSEQRRKGVKLSYNIKLKKTCFLIARSFILFQTPPYFHEYERSKVFYTENRRDWPKGRCDLAARRKMIKLFLSHLYTVWRKAEGLAWSLPFAQSNLGHSNYMPPPEKSS